MPVVLDVKALDEIGIDRAQPVTFRAARIQLRQALNHILRESGLTYLVRDEVLVITVPITTTVQSQSWDRMGGPGSQFAA